MVTQEQRREAALKIALTTARIASPRARAVPSPESGSKASPAVPQASHPGPLRGDRMRGLAAKAPDGSRIDSIHLAIKMLRHKAVAGEDPTDGSRPESTASGKSQQSSKDSIQQDAESWGFLKRSGAAWAIPQPKQCSTGSDGSGRGAKIAKSVS